MVPSLTPYDLSFHMPQDTQMAMSATSDPIHFMFGSRVFRVDGLNGAISGYIKSKLAARRHLG